MRILLLSCLLLVLACETISSFETNDLVGDWQAASWVDETNNKTIDVTVSFKFDDQGRYVGRYGTALEKGSYWISGDNLHTVEDGKAEKKVKIEQLSNDTLVFGMNRAGNIERLTLVKLQ